MSHVWACVVCSRFVFFLFLTSTFPNSLSTCSLSGTSSSTMSSPPRVKKQLHSRTMRSIAPWRDTIFSQGMNWPNEFSVLDREFPSRNLRKGEESRARRAAVTEGKVQNSFTERKIGECFQRKTIGFCSRRDTCSFLHTHATGHREIMWKEVGDARRSHLAKASSSVPEVKEQSDVRSSNRLKASPVTRV